ncbi:myb family transcription factor EFM [Olea europaea subsp. europaea]|uniref:Myb family transcription factor EFM n=1 Tax=Olea europaea subsp. europaea TaxID=158383 RepID=A0A8S0UA87_OLEEU|nr:myb family transcription factor EFM [Olea europaea subsp. europaea]
MMTSSSELSLECKPYSHSMLLKSFGEQIADSDTKKLEEFLAGLEEERLKIDAFKRELPLCIQLLTNAMEASRQQLQSYRANAGQRPVLEEFIPLKNTSSEGIEKATNMSDKTNWMTSVQLWSQSNEESTNQQSSPKESDMGFGVNPKIGLDDRQRNGGAFHPFLKDSRNSCPSPSLTNFADLALASSHKEMEENKTNSEARRENSGKCSDSSAEKGQVKDSQTAGINHSTAAQNHRKARRCWSPDLHRRFVNALQMLGGSQVATPKQIRELMKVDGLTNDEVKSHLQARLSNPFSLTHKRTHIHSTKIMCHLLSYFQILITAHKYKKELVKLCTLFIMLSVLCTQKYRLHTRRPSPSPQAVATAGPQVVFLGGIWVPQDYAAAAAVHAGGAPAAIYGAHPSNHVSATYCATQPGTQEFYSALTPQQPPIHHQLHVYKPPLSQAQTHNSPGSDVPGGTGDRSESMEDGKSESSSWKADSVVENGERKRSLLKEEGEESNGSEITLKF